MFQIIYLVKVILIRFLTYKLYLKKKRKAPNQIINHIGTNKIK
jgi:hypothetical protein